MAITFHRVPKPEYVDKTYISKNKIEGVGWDNLGQRKPKFIALHRMLGSLNSTEDFFAPPNSPHLTDFAIGVAAQDGKARAGEIDQYNDPLGYKSGWASGRVSKPYGDGLAIVNKYGINAVNRDGISIEISGYQKTPIDDEAWAALVHFCAYWVDFMEIPFDSLPLNPHTGINAFIWHQEFTIGTGKECPFEEVMRRTHELYQDTATFLKPYQTGGGVIISLPVEPEVPKPNYAKPLPIAELTQYRDSDRDIVTALVTREADQFIFVADRVEAVQDTPRLQYAAMSAPQVGPVLRKGEKFDVTWMVKAADGNWFYVTDWWTRIRVDHTKRILDATGAA